MYGIPEELVLNEIIGEFTTQFRIGAYDFQFSLGHFDFNIQTEFTIKNSQGSLFKWTPGEWPPSEFMNLYNVEVEDVKISKEEISILFNNKYQISLVDDSPSYESFLIQNNQSNETWVV